MRELPEPKIEVKLPIMLDGDIEVIESFTRDQVLAIQKQAYEDGLKDAWSKITGSFASDAELRNGMVLATNLISDMLAASQKDVCNICGKQHIDPSFNCLLNQVVLTLNSARASKAASK